jgi:hypothetical protein
MVLNGTHDNANHRSGLDIVSSFSHLSTINLLVFLVQNVQNRQSVVTL